MPPRPSSPMMRYRPPSKVPGTNRPSSAMDNEEMCETERATAMVSAIVGSERRSILTILRPAQCGRPTSLGRLPGVGAGDDIGLVIAAGFKRGHQMVRAPLFIGNRKLRNKLRLYLL